MHEWAFSKSLGVFKIQTFSIDPSVEIFVSTLQSIVHGILLCMRKTMKH